MFEWIEVGIPIMSNYFKGIMPDINTIDDINIINTTKFS